MRAGHPPTVERGPLGTIAGALPLYARIMGDTWSLLPEPVRALHTTQTTTRARGFLRIDHGRHRLARVIVRAFRLPPAAAATRTELAVIAQEDGERWERTFGAATIETHQSADGVGLVERYGVLEFRFDLRASRGRLVYCQREAALRLFTVRLRLPESLAPHIEASEDVAGARRITIAVTVTLPMIGMLIAYGGIIDVVETGA